MHHQKVSEAQPVLPTLLPLFDTATDTGYLRILKTRAENDDTPLPLIPNRGRGAVLETAPAPSPEPRRVE